MNICVLGAGAWGTAFALHLVRLGHTVTLVPRRFEHAIALGEQRENSDYLPGFRFPENLQIGFELKPVLMEADVAVLASPVVGIREWCERIQAGRGSARALRLVLSLAKGVEIGTYKTPSAIASEILGDLEVGTVTGPSNAEEVAAGKPTALLLATSRHSDFADAVQAGMSGPSLRLYTSDALVGAELGGGLKNVYAIAAGMSDGLGLGDNAKAALLTRALAEMIRIGRSLGTRDQTFMGLSGYGDLVATCYGSWSRNRSFGQQIGEGATPQQALEGRRTVVEGHRTCESVHQLCLEKGIQAPILEQVHAVLYEGREPREALSALMNRTLRREFD
ncbi:MAG: NAD(P)-dependent glycerol-3-phosphate dehydrogenase [Verrucomicrobia bacterium]|nr:MAG: NAD(P)-dependent glycerol-3-phosphate dehydrogenase [Verrucomicrobiota bacterium]